jgi:hypothetical protein
MNCAFRILWFEDEGTWFTSQKRKLEDFLETHCLKAQVTRKRGGDFTDSELTGNFYDLIMMDYKLTTEETGEKIIEKIRHCHILTDILFYSSRYSEMLESVMKLYPPIDGVFYADRKDVELDPKLEGLISKIIQRSEDIVNLRGFVLDNTCDFEVRIKEILNMCWQKFGDKQRTELTDLVIKVSKSNTKRSNDLREKILSEGEKLYPSAVNDKYFFSHSDRLIILNSIIEVMSKNYEFKKIGKYIDFKRNYEEDLSIYRNALGHRKDGDATLFIKGNEIPINQELHRKLRYTLNEYNELITSLEDYVTQQM